jgi:hypothetical protein
MDERDWIIARLLYALYEEGRNATHPDAIKSAEWFANKHGHKHLMYAFSRVCDENRKYEPYWLEKGKWK